MTRNARKPVGTMLIAGAAFAAVSLLGVVGVAGVVGVVGVVGGCSSGGSGTQREAQSGGVFGLFAPRKDPNKELTPAEGRKLLIEIRKDPKRTEKLTYAEKVYLAKLKAAAESNQ